MRIVVILAALSAAGAATAAEDPGAPVPATAPAPEAAGEAQQGVIVYPPEFFAAARPATALDMVQRTPGFSFENGSAVRGFAGGAGNVLIDGERPLTKTETLDEILRKIPASSILRIEVIRGGAPGIDMQGRTVLANVVRRQDGASAGAFTFSNFTLWDGRNLPGIRAEFSTRGHGQLTELSLVLGQGPDDSVGAGRRRRVTGAGVLLIDSEIDAGAYGTKYWVTAAHERPFDGGRLRLSSVIQYTPSQSDYFDRLYTPASVERERIRTPRGNADFGIRFTRPLNAQTGFEGVLLQSFTYSAPSDIFTSPSVTRDFNLESRTGETIARTAVTWRASPTFSVEYGGEGAFNWLTSKTSLIVNGVAAVVPSANVKVQELRGDVFAAVTWRALPTLNVDAGLHVEGSRLTASGDTSLEKTLWFPKPRLVMTWSPNPANQVRFRLEREVGQLNFNDFVAASSVASTGTVIAGNPDINPQQAWVVEAAYERRFWRGGVIALTARYYQLTDVVDRAPVLVCPTGATCPPTAPVFSSVDAPGNIGDGTRQDLGVQLTLPLTNFGVTGGLLKGGLTRRWSQVTDPVTGVRREISSLRPLEWDLHFSQDLPNLRMNWGIDAYSQFRETAYRVSEIETRELNAFVTLYTEIKPRRDFVIRAELQNLLARGSTRIREVYTGPRNTSPINYIDTRELQGGLMLLVRLRKTFG